MTQYLRSPAEQTNWCPHCGGATGWVTSQRRTVTRLRSWEGDSHDLDDEKFLSETVARCADCEKPVHKHLATVRPEGVTA